MRRNPLTEPARTTLVGRTAELSDLRHHLAACSRGESQVVTVGGEAGIGKSRLLAEFARALPESVRVVVGHCLELGPDGPPFAPFAMILRSLDAEIGTETLADFAGPGRGDLALLVPELGSVAPGDPFGRGRLFESMASLVERIAEDSPLVLVFEDLHWSDSSTRDLVKFLIRTVSEAQLLVILTYRTDDLTRHHPLPAWLAEIGRSRRAHRIILDRLSDHEVDEMVRQLAGEVPGRLRSRIRERSQGVPFFVEELTECCDTDLTIIPESLRDLMLARLDGLSPPTRDIVRIASAADTRVDHEVLLRVVGDDEDSFDSGLREAVNGQILVVDAPREGYAFRHALMREAVHADLLPGEHARLHARYAEALEVDAGPARAAEIAHHWNSAHQADRSFVWSLRAADHSATIYAWREQLTHLERALDLWDQVPDPEPASRIDRVDLLTSAGHAAGDSGQPERAVALFDAALAEMSADREPGRIARVLIERARQCEIVRRDTLDDLARAMELAPAGSADRAAAMSATATRLMVDGNPDSAEEWARRAIEAARAADSLHLVGEATNTLGCVLIQRGRTEQGLACLEEARRAAIDSGDWPGLLRYHGNYSDVLIGLGRFEEAAETARMGRTASMQRGLSRTIGSFLAGNEAEALVLACRWDTALEIIDEALRLDPPPVTRAHLHLERAKVLVQRGDRAGSADQLDLAAQHLAGAASQPQYAMPLAAVRAELLHEEGKVTEAADLLAETGAAVVDRASTASGWPFAWTWARLGQETALSRDLVDGLFRISEHGGWRALVSAELAGAAADWGSTVSALEAGEGLDYQLAYARVRWAETLLSEPTDRQTAREQLERAVRAAEQLGAAPLVSYAGRVAGTARIAIRPAAADPHRLTPREHEVLELVAAGKSNRAISQDLFISVKTASVHVSNILAKIGASSRTEAAAWAHQNLA